jgi:tRNA pseudouridine55 synthase
MAPNGILVIDKPAGMTSHDVVARVRRIFQTKKVGHAGTLDPDATGLLILGLGNATRLLSFAQDGPKRYLATASFGTTTSTQDASGDVIETKPVNVDRNAVERAALAFVGDIEQIPPMVSAVKVGGERLYKKARRGEEVERKPRPVTIHTLSVTGFSAEPPEANLDVTCSPGTYIRTLVHDIGQSLGCGGHLKGLRRVEAAGFSEEDAVSLDDVSTVDLRPALQILRSLPRLDIDQQARGLVSDGRPLPLPDIDLAKGDLVAIVGEGSLMAIYKKQGPQLVAEKVIPS